MTFEQRDAPDHCGFFEVTNADAPAEANSPDEVETELYAELAEPGLLSYFLELRALIGEYRESGRLDGEPSVRAQLMIMDRARVLHRDGHVRTVRRAINVAFLAVLHEWIR